MFKLSEIFKLKYIVSNFLYYISINLFIIYILYILPFFYNLVVIIIIVVIHFHYNINLNVIIHIYNI